MKHTKNWQEKSKDSERRQKRKGEKEGKEKSNEQKGYGRKKGEANNQKSWHVDC
jgi:hypothetical protein